jgi:hypothetical protein
VQAVAKRQAARRRSIRDASEEHTVAGRSEEGADEWRSRARLCDELTHSRALHEAASAQEPNWSSRPRKPPAQRPASAAARREPRCRAPLPLGIEEREKTQRQGGRLHPASTASRASPPNELPPESCQSVGVHYHALFGRGRSLRCLNSAEILPYFYLAELSFSLV